MPGLIHTLPSTGTETLQNRTDARKEVNRSEWPNEGYVPVAEEGGIPTFYPLPKTGMMSGKLNENANQNFNAVTRTTVEESSPRRRVSLIELNWGALADDANEPVAAKASRPQRE